MALEITSSRAVLIVFPNIFAFWFLFVAALQHWWPNHELTLNRLAIWLLVLLALKIFQMYSLHGAKWLDNYVPTQVVAYRWNSLTGWI
jgi:hypothetical protein